MTEIVLPGCQCEPLGSYLKAIGLLRLVAEQVDARATGWWRGDTFVIDSSLDLEGMAQFLVGAYRPTPIITPWNKGSGFAPGDSTKSKTAFTAVSQIADATDARLSGYRDAIAVARALAAHPDWEERPKEEQVLLCRNALPDEALPWLDAAVVITTQEPVFPSLLGTGGNDGRLDFGSNFMQRLIDMLRISAKPRKAAEIAALARSALTGEQTVAFDRIPIGQFDPAATGGPGSGPFGAGIGLANPWDFILLFEGAVMFASGVARRLSSEHVSASSIPFSVPAVAAGHPSAASESSRRELWAPLWRRPATAGELRRLIAEGRVEYRGKQARTALDVARALGSLGADRGIDAFVRYGFLERNGSATFSVPVGRFQVPSRPNRTAPMLGQLDGWLQRLRRLKNPPASLDGRLRRIDTLQFELSHGDSPTGVQNLLIEVASIEALAARSTAIREGTRGPVNGLRAGDWLPILVDGSVELELAVALASLRPAGKGRGWLRQIVIDPEWKGRRPKVDGLGRRPILDVLADALTQILLMNADQRKHDNGGCFGNADAVWAPPSALSALLSDEVDLRRLEELLCACLLLDWSSGARMPTGPQRSSIPARLAPAFAVLKPSFHHRLLPNQPRPLRATTRWGRLLQSGLCAQALELGLRELRLGGHELAVHSPELLAHGLDPHRLAAACLVPMSDTSVQSLLRRITLDNDNNELEQS